MHQLRLLEPKDRTPPTQTADGKDVAALSSHPAGLAQQSKLNLSRADSPELR